MRRFLRKGVDTALGIAVSGYRQVRNRADELAETGEASRAKMRDQLAEETEEWRETGRDQAARIEELVRGELERAFQGAQLVTRQDYDAMEREIAGLRARIGELESQIRQLREEGPT